jgi:release factor glutamine methyltransferase
MQTIQTILRHATAQLKAHSPEPESAGFEAQLLLTHVLKVNRAWLIAHGDGAMSAENAQTFEGLLARRLAGEPMAYILGEREFFGLNFKVTPDTLIPRPDTEVLVDAALEKIAFILRQAQDEREMDTFSPSFPRKRESIFGLNVNLDSRFRGNDGQVNVLDLGTGTGAIALAIAKHATNTQVTAVDFSKAALLVAQQNAQNLNIHNVRFVHSDWFSALKGQRFDVIVSNPPYIEADDVHLSQGDVRFEPLSALASGADGLDDIRKIIQHAPQHLNAKGWLLFEHGYNQAPAVGLLLAEAGFQQIGHALDLAGIQRVTFGQI